MGNKQVKNAISIEQPQNSSYPTTFDNTSHFLIEKKIENPKVISPDILDGVKQPKIARTIIKSMTNSGHTVSDNDVTKALAFQQSQKVGALVKLDYIAILIRLNPSRNNALISQYKAQDLIDLIRFELYNKPLGL